MAEKKTIAVLGCGWLGLPLAKKLISEGFRVKGSVRTPEKFPELQGAGIEAFAVEVSPEIISGEIQKFLSETDILIIDIPPGLRKNPDLKFSEGIEKLAQEIQSSGVKKVLFVSSIAVYEETEELPVYTEDDPPNAISGSGPELIKAERILQENDFFDTTVLRFGGLIGAERHPVKVLAGRKGVQNPLGAVNLIHQEDCLRVIKKIVEKDIFGEVFNAVAPLHPSRENYYSEQAREAGLPLPEFDHSRPSAGKMISSSKIIRDLGVELERGISC